MLVSPGLPPGMRKIKGLFVRFKELTDSHPSSLLYQFLNDSFYADNARHFQQVITEADGLSQAATVIRRVFQMAQYNLKR
jgi:UDP:flavonoid glycosyltransferase YjiC (YdhE family)